MTRFDKLFLGLCAIFLSVGLIHTAMADTGHEGATRTESGSYMETRRVIVSSTAGTALFSASVRRPDGNCRIIAAGNVVYIGTTSATQEARTHVNIEVGYPVYSTETIRLNSFTGGMFATAGIEQSNVEVRCVDFLVR